MGNVLYSAENFGFDHGFVILFFLLIGIAYCGRSTCKSCKVKNDIKTLMIVRVFFLAVFVIISIITVIWLTSDINLHESYNEYKNGNYKMVEGYVEDFVPMLKTERGNETFSINGVLFSYGTGRHGYQTRAWAGGVIKHNGQHLRIKYISAGMNGKIILYIEELQ